MEVINAYIDESGDPRFNEGASERLEFSAVLIEAVNEGKTIEQLNNIKAKFNLKEFKSSRIRQERRRIQILKELQEVDFKFINLSIDKSRVYGVWKHNPKVFYKYTQKILHRELHRLYPDRNVTIDQFSDEKYQESLKIYLEDNSQLELFNSVLNIGSAKNNVLIQLSDLIAGTNRKLIGGEFESPIPIRGLLAAKELHLLVWPENFNRLNIDSIKDKEDKNVADISISYADRYIENNKEDPSFNHRIMILEYLLFQVKFIDKNSYIYSLELISWLEKNNIKYSEEEFRKNIIGPLRDDGVVIAGSRKGMKIPMSVTELVDYLSYTSSRYITMIKRFKETFKTLNGSALGSIEIFNSDEFKIHKKLFKLLDDL